MPLAFLTAVADFSPAQVFTLWIVAMGIAFLLLVSLAGILVPAWAAVQKTRLDTALKQQMVERAMSAAEIVQVLEGRAQDRTSVNYPCASEVVVESEGEWSPGLILQRTGDRYLVHYVGYDMSDNEWVPADRVRFPAAPKDPCGAPWDWASSAGAWAANPGCAHPSKPAPVDAEL